MANYSGKKCSPTTYPFRYVQTDRQMDDNRANSSTVTKYGWLKTKSMCTRGLQ